MMFSQWRKAGGHAPAAAPALGLALGCALVAGGAPAAGAGFDLFAQNARATGLAGAYTALVDDPSAVFYNPGALALPPPPGGKKKKVALGITPSTLNESLYQGLSPGAGAGTTGAQETGFSLPAHAYLALPLGEKAAFGLGLYTPFLLDTAWQDAGTFAGRFVATSGELVTYDVAPTIGFQLAPTLGVGFGAIYRTSELRLGRRFASADPITGRPVDVATVAVDSDFESGIGFTAGVAHRPSPGFSWGLGYRSAIEIDFGAITRLTQIETGDPVFDNLIRATLPFGQDLATATTLELPDRATLGVAVGLGSALRLVVDAERTGWSSVDAIVLTVPDAPRLSQRLALSFADTMSYRVGLEWTFPTGPQLRAGVALEESPQPDETVGPVLPDADRMIVSAGFGLDWLQLAFAWVDFEQRVVTTNVDGINGNWRSSGWMVGLTIIK